MANEIYLLEQTQPQGGKTAVMKNAGWLAIQSTAKKQHANKQQQSAIFSEYNFLFGLVQ